MGRVAVPGVDNGLLSKYYGLLMGALNGAGICASFDEPQSRLRDLAASFMPTLRDVTVRTLDMVDSGDDASDHRTISTTAGALGHIAAVSSGAGIDTGFVSCAQPVCGPGDRTRSPLGTAPHRCSRPSEPVSVERVVARSGSPVPR